MTIAVQYSDVVIITTALTKASNQGWGSVSDCLLHRVMPELDPKDEGWARHGDEEEGSAGKRSRSEKTTGQAPLPFKCTGRCRELAKKKLEMEEQPTTGGFQARGDCWVFMSYTQPKPTVAEGWHTEPILHPPYIYTLRHGTLEFPSLRSEPFPTPWSSAGYGTCYAWWGISKQGWFLLGLGLTLEDERHTEKEELPLLRPL